MAATASRSPSERAAATLEARREAIETSIDERAERVRAGYRRERERIGRDPNLSELGRQTAQKEARDKAREQMAELRAELHQKRGELTATARSALFGTAPSRAADLAVHRDARREAAALTDVQQARRALDAALGSGDMGLARELARTAHDRPVGPLETGTGWREVADTWAQRTGSGELLTQLRGLETAGDRGGPWRFSV